MDLEMERGGGLQSSEDKKEKKGGGESIKFYSGIAHKSFKWNARCILSLLCPQPSAEWIKCSRVTSHHHR